jgi:O-methyltransferase
MSDVSLEDVREYVGYAELTIYFKGLFEEVLPNLPENQFSFVHVDCDLYKSVITVCRYIYDRVNSRGLILFDDYGFKGEPGVKLAVDEFFTDKPEKPFYLPTGQALVFKI